MGSHPEPGPFQVAAGRSMGDERTLRIFLEIARWADDIRGSEYDHPTWHSLFRPVIDANDPPSKGAPYVTSGNAPEALALSIAMARTPRDRKIGVSGKRVSVRVAHGGSRPITKNNNSSIVIN